jgi:polysaccharide pyruvyl transferase WcaK-like protein
MNILVFNPALKDNQGALNDNLGDCIIWDSVQTQLKSIFGQTAPIQAISSQIDPGKREKGQIKAATHRFVGGTNLINSYMRYDRQWKVPVRTMAWRHPAVLMGVGWQNYQSKPTRTTKLILHAILSHKYLHSVRDGYTENKLRLAGVKNVVNTSCPTLWDLAGAPRIINAQKPAERVLLMLTDYRTDEAWDRKLVDCLAAQYKEIILWPQGPGDRYYGSHLLFNVRSKARVLEYSMSSLDSLLASPEPLDYVGTRLHGGIKCLKAGKRGLILAVDNRATEIGKETGLPTVQRDEIEKVRQWITTTSPCKIHIPEEPILKWKRQFVIS